MKVLWLINLVLPKAASALGIEAGVGGSWLEGQISILEFKKNICLTVACFASAVKSKQVTQQNGITYIVLPLTQVENQESYLSLQTDKYDVIHIYGTETPHSWNMLAWGQPEKTLVTIQGLVYRCAPVYLSGIPNCYKKANVFKKIVRFCAPAAGGLLAEEKAQMEHAGEREKKLLKKAGYISGRTRWDHSSLAELSCHAQYFHCGEILRDSFYQRQWSIEECTPHRIFVSQGNYPIKGLHFLLKRMPAILEKWPDTTLVVAGRAPYDFGNKIVQMGIDFIYEYQRYIKLLIRNLKLENKVVFTGPLNETEMCQAYLDSHLFISTSVMENSPNSLGEAMALGMPCIASMVGGVADMMTDETEGYLYPAGEDGMLPYYVDCLFSQPSLAVQLGKAARSKAIKNHEPEKITKDLLTIYNSISVNKDIE